MRLRERDMTRLGHRALKGTCSIYWECDVLVRLEDYFFSPQGHRGSFVCESVYTDELFLDAHIYPRCNTNNDNHCKHGNVPGCGLSENCLKACATYAYTYCPQDGGICQCRNTGSWWFAGLFATFLVAWGHHFGFTLHHSVLKTMEAVFDEGLQGNSE